MNEVRISEEQAKKIESLDQDLGLFIEKAVRNYWKKIGYNPEV